MLCVLSKNIRQFPQPGLQPRLLDPETSTLTLRPPCLPHKFYSRASVGSISIALWLPKVDCVSLRRKNITDAFWQPHFSMWQKKNIQSPVGTYLIKLISDAFTGEVDFDIFSFPAILDVTFNLNYSALVYKTYTRLLSLKTVFHAKKLYYDLLQMMKCGIEEELPKWWMISLWRCFT